RPARSTPFPYTTLFRSLDQEQVPLGIDLVHGQADLGDALAAHPAGHANTLEHARGRRRRADRARPADVVRAVRLRAAAEVVPLRSEEHTSELQSLAYLV